MFVDASRNLFSDDGALVQNMQGKGAVGSTLEAVRFDPGLMRPYWYNGERFCTVNTGKKKLNNQTGKYHDVYANVPVRMLEERGIYSPVFNATALQQRAWIDLDAAVQEEYLKPLTAWADLAARNTRSGFDGMSKLTIEYQSMSQVGEALQDMDGVSEGRTDRPLFDLKSIPLPITHADYFFTRREMAVAANTSTPLDTTMARMEARAIGVFLEQQTIGNITGMTYGTQTAGYGTHTGTSTVYGYRTTPYKISKTDLTTPTGSNPEAVMTDFLEMVDQMQSYGFYGPYLVYTSTGYSRYLNDDYFRSGSTSAVRSLRERVLEIEGITSIKRLEYLTSGYQVIMIQLDPNIAQAVIGMPLTTVQWPSQGGMRENFKIMTISVPLIKTPYTGVTGILHATTS